MNIHEKLGEALNVKLTDDYRGAVSLEIGTWNTACLLYTSDAADEP